MTDERAKRRLVGVYVQHPEEMLTHAISVTFEIAAAMMVSRRTSQALLTVCADPKLAARAARLIMGHMLRQMVTTEDPSPEDFETLVQDVAKLAKES